MNIKTWKMTAIALSIGAMTIAGSVIAGSHGAGMGEVQKVNPPAVEQGAPEPYLTEQELADVLESQGYTDIKKIELEDGEYEVKARDADGRRVEIYADPRTGEILKSKVKE